MASLHKPWRAEYAKSSRSSCKTCKSPITKENFRLGKLVQASQFDGVMPVRLSLFLSFSSLYYTLVLVTVDSIALMLLSGYQISKLLPFRGFMR